MLQPSICLIVDLGLEKGQKMVTDFLLSVDLCHIHKKKIVEIQNICLLLGILFFSLQVVSVWIEKSF